MIPAGNKDRARRVLMVSSSGGHWIQLNRLRPCFEGWSFAFACTDAGYGATLKSGDRFYAIPEATRWNKLRLVWQALKLLWILLRERPDTVISTGAAPGFFAMLFGRLLRRRTIWVDSIANFDEMSLSGQQARRYSDLWLTQWPHLAQPGGPAYYGALL
jgi:hypothetical protein